MKRSWDDEQSLKHCATSDQSYIIVHNHWQVGQQTDHTPCKLAGKLNSTNTENQRVLNP